MVHIDLTKENVLAIEKLYTDALVEGKETFKFQGHEVFTEYAKYVVEHGKSKLNLK